jgi:hypothetical protein
MNHLTFQERVLHDKTIPAFIRLVARKALTDLRTAPVDAGTTHVEPWVFWKLVKFAQAEPIKSGKYTFIRIYDENHNSVDIQTLNS